MELRELWAYMLEITSSASAFSQVVSGPLKTKRISKTNLKVIRDNVLRMNVRDLSEADKKLRKRIIQLLQFI